MSENYFSSGSLRDKLLEEYEKSRSLYARLVDEVLYILRTSIDKSKLKIHSLIARETKIKTFESFYNAVVRKQIMKNHLETIEDIAGVRVICLYRSDLEILNSIVSKNFDIIRIDTSRTRTETPFGYSSDHYVVKLPKKCRGPRYDSIKNLKCEIQVRTIPMDAWASVSHHLDYKQNVDIPRDLRTSFNALAGLFHVADTIFELFKKGIEQTRADLMRTVEEDMFDLDQEINLDSLVAYLKWKFPERIERKRDPATSEIIKELRECGYQNVRQLDDKINIAKPVVKQLENEAFEQKKWRPQWTFDGLIRAFLDLADDEYFKERFGRRTPDSTLRVDLRRDYVKSLRKYRAKLH